MPWSNGIGPATIFTARWWDWDPKPDGERWVPDDVGVLPYTMENFIGPYPSPELGELVGTEDEWENGLDYDTYLAGGYSNPNGCWARGVRLWFDLNFEWGASSESVVNPSGLEFSGSGQVVQGGPVGGYEFSGSGQVVQGGPVGGYEFSGSGQVDNIYPCGLEWSGTGAFYPPVAGGGGVEWSGAAGLAAGGAGLEWSGAGALAAVEALAFDAGTEWGATAVVISSRGFGGAGGTEWSGMADVVCIWPEAAEAGIEWSGTGEPVTVDALAFDAGTEWGGGGVLVDVTPFVGVAGWESSGSALVESIVQYLPGYMDRLNLKYLTANTVSVAPGNAVDTLATTLLNLAALTTLDLTATGLNGLDKTNLAGTVATTNTIGSVVGTGTAFLTDFAPRTGTGTCASAGTAVTGTGTKFLSEVRPGDLFGSTANTYSRVLSVTSDAALVLDVGLSGGNMSAGTAFKVCEQPTISCTGLKAGQILQILSDTSLTAINTATATATGLTASRGGLTITNGTNAVLPVFLVSGSGGVGVIASTQRTIPYGVATYAAIYRKVGSLVYDGYNAGGAGTLIPFTQGGNGRTREYQFECAVNLHNTTLKAAGNATAWSVISAANVLPSGATRVKFTNQLLNPSAFVDVFYTANPVADGSLNRPHITGGFALVDNLSTVEVQVNECQQYWYVLTGAVGNVLSNYCGGYVEEN